MEQPWSTPDFPEWIASPESAWNYGLILDSSHPDAGVKLRRKAMTSDPWTDPPLSLEVNARKIDDWKIQQSPTNSQQRFTPPLPDVRLARLSDSVEKLTLVPYGSTHLRVTIFPHLGPSLINDLAAASFMISPVITRDEIRCEWNSVEVNYVWEGGGPLTRLMPIKLETNNLQRDGKI